MKSINALLTLAITFLVATLAMQGRYELAALSFVAGSAVSFGLHYSPSPTPSLYLNTFTNLIADAYAALNVVSRELTGALSSVTRDPRADRCAQNATMRNPIARTNSAVGNVTPGMAFPTAAYQTFDNRSFTIQKSRFAPFSWTGEEEYTMNENGPGSLNLQQQQIAEAIRALVNEMEADVCTYGALGASRAYGTAGTTPFATNLADAAQIRKILDDNGAPLSGRSAVINTSAGAALRTLGQLTKANEAGNTMTLRDGEILNIHGISFKESAQVYNATKGTGASYQLSAALAVGDTTVNVDTGSGTILAGDIVTIGAHKYVVTTALSGGSFTIEKPGILAVVADNTAITVNDTAARNLVFTQNAMLLGTRLPASVGKGDLRIDSEVVTDPRTGIAFEIVAWPGTDMVTYHVRAAWGVAVMKPEHIAVLLG